MAEDVGPVSHLQREVDVLLDQQHTDTGVDGDLTEHREEPLDDDGRQAEAHLVDHQQLWLRGQRTRHGQHLLLASGQQAGLAIQQRFERREVAEGLRQPVVPLGRCDAEVLLHRQLEEQAAILGHMGEATARHKVGATAFDGLPDHLDVTVQDRDQGRRREERGRLPCAVGPEEHDHFAFVHVQVHSAHDGDAVVATRHVDHLEQRHVGRSRSPRRPSTASSLRLPLPR